LTEKKRVLFLCTGNSARSQMAEGLLRNLAGERFEVFSAGTVATFVRPQSIAVMNEIGIDISQHRSKSLDEFIDEEFDYVITVCDHANQRCPVFPGAVKRIHWSVDDPVGSGSESAQLEAFRRARDELRERLQSFSRTN
jgi:arsenate reductase (thioredoxin)